MKSKNTNNGNSSVVLSAVDYSKHRSFWMVGSECPFSVDPIAPFYIHCEEYDNGEFVGAVKLYETNSLELAKQKLAELKRAL